MTAPPNTPWSAGLTTLHQKVSTNISIARNWVCFFYDQKSQDLAFLKALQQNGGLLYGGRTN
jgi:hypothetical protein